MIKIKITNIEFARGVSLFQKLKEMGFTRFRGKIVTLRYFTEGYYLYNCYPTKGDLLSKRF